MYLGSIWISFGNDLDKAAFCFRNGTTLEALIQRLQNGQVHPMADEFLVLRVAKAEFRDRPPKYYTFDHRRLYCMWKASVPKIHVRIVLEGEAFNEFARKCNGLGHHISCLRLRN